MRVPLLETSSLVLQVYNGSVGLQTSKRPVLSKVGQSWESKEGLQLSGATIPLHQQACFLSPAV